jgi:NAD(P)-dependent dehydrogenase (short-subunit alcohol dehydrogenase family)
MSLSGKVALVTGASAGIGAAVAQALAEAGAHVLLADIDEAGLRRVQSGIGDEQAQFRRTDVSDPAAMQAAVDDAVRRWGGLDIAILNAGIEGVVAPITDYPVERFDQVIAVNLRGVFLGLKSVAGVQGTPGLSAYTASKHAVIGLMKCAALELAPQNIRVNSVNPGPIETQMMRSIEDGLSPGQGEAVHGALAKAIPLQRYGSAEEVARLTVFLASDAGAYCSGGIYMVDGGMTAGRAVGA